MWMLFMTTAMATPLDRFVWQAEVDLAACESCESTEGVGVYALPIPAELRGLSQSPDGTELLLVNAAGEEVPFALAEFRPATERDLDIQATNDVNVWMTGALDVPIDGLRVTLPGQPWATTVTVSRQDGTSWIPIAEALVFRHPMGSEKEVLFPSTADPLRIEYRHHFTGASSGTPGLVGIVDPAPFTAASEFTVPVGAPTVQEDGWAVYTIQLPHELPFNSFRLHVEDELFDRAVHVRDIERDYWSDSYFNGPRIQRASIGNTRVEFTNVHMDQVQRTDEILVYVEANGKQPLTITQATLELPGRTLLLRDPGPGPFTVYGGAPRGTRSASDLQLAEAELQRLATQVLTAGPVTNNPAYQPVELRSGVAAPGAELKVSSWAFARAVQGEGLAFIDIPADVLAEARGDLADLRLVTADNQQVPYVLRQRPTHRQQATEPTRTEDGSTTRIRVPSPHAQTPVASVTLATDAAIFERNVTVFRARGARLEPLRSMRWIGQDHPTRVSLSIDAPVGDELVIEIDNGDNPPLPITSIQLGLPDWELVAVIPPNTRLLYGNSRARAPDYELALITSDVLLRAQTPATLGAEEVLTKPPVPLLQQVVLGGALALMVLVLIGMVVVVVREESDEGDDVDGNTDSDDLKRDDVREDAPKSEDAVGDSTDDAPPR